MRLQPMRNPSNDRIHHQNAIIFINNTLDQHPPTISSSSSSSSYPSSHAATSSLRMYMKSIALFVAIYGRTALADLSDSCQDGETSCDACTPLNTEFEPPGVGQVWYSHCCTVSDTNTADPPVTTSKKYCHSYYLSGYPNNQFSGTKPTCSESGSGTSAWLRNGQCKTTGGVSSC
jgi:hypothetical protein